MPHKKFLTIDDSELLQNDILVRDLMFFTTLSCNLRCKTCYVGDEWLKSGIRFDQNEGLSLLHHFASRGLDRLTFLGGEPLTDPNITEYILAASKYKIKEKRLTTNALELGHLDLSRLKGDSLDHITISFDGITKEKHEHIRGPLTFDRTLKNLEILKKHGFRIHANLTVTGYNKDEIINSVKFFKELGVKEVNYHLVSIIGNAKKHSELKITPKEWIDIRQQLENIEDVKGITLRIPYMYVTKAEYDRLVAEEKYYPIQKKSYHSKDGQRIVIYPNGKVYISCDLTGSEYNFASYKDCKFSVLKNLNELSYYKQKSQLPDVSSNLLSLESNGFVRLSISYKEKLHL